MKNLLPNDELLSAYLDGEVTGRERELVERALRESPQLLRALEELRRVQVDLRGLPKLRLEPDFCDQVLRQAQRTMLLSESRVEETRAEQLHVEETQPSAAVQTSDHAAPPLNARSAPARAGDTVWRAGWQPAARGGRFQQFQRVAAALAVLVPALVLMVLATRDPRSGVARVATTEHGDAERGNDAQRDNDARNIDAKTDGTEKFRNQLDSEALDRAARFDRKSSSFDSLADAPFGEAGGLNGHSRADKGGAGTDGEGREIKGHRSYSESSGAERPNAVFQETAPSEAVRKSTVREGAVQGGDAAKTGRGASSARAKADTVDGDVVDGLVVDSKSGATPGGTKSHSPAAKDSLAGDELKARRAETGEREEGEALAEGKDQGGAPSDGLLVVRLSVTEQAWKNGAVNEWLASYQTARASQRPVVGKLWAEDALLLRQATGGGPQAGQPRPVEEKGKTGEVTRQYEAASSKKSDENVAGKRLGSQSGPETSPPNHREQRENLANNNESSGKNIEAATAAADDSKHPGKKGNAEKRSESRTAADNALAGTAAADKQRDAGEKRDVSEKLSVIELDATTDDIYALLNSLNTRAKAKGEVVSLTVVLPQGGQEQAAQLSSPSQLGAFAAAQSKLADTFAEFAQPSYYRSANQPSAIGPSLALPKAGAGGAGASQAPGGGGFGGGLPAKSPDADANVKAQEFSRTESKSRSGGTTPSVNGAGGLADGGEAKSPLYKEKETAERLNEKKAKDAASLQLFRDESQRNATSPKSGAPAAAATAPAGKSSGKPKQDKHEAAIDPRTGQRAAKLGSEPGEGAGGPPSPPGANPGAVGAAKIVTGAATAKTLLGRPGEPGFGFDPAIGPTYAPTDRTKLDALGLPGVRPESTAPPQQGRTAAQNGAASSRRLRAIIIVQVVPTGAAQASSSLQVGPSVQVAPTSGATSVKPTGTPAEAAKEKKK